MKLKSIQIPLLRPTATPPHTATSAHILTPTSVQTPTPTQLPEIAFTPVPTTKAGEAEIAARMRLAAALGMTEQALTVYSTESLDWSNASLGCPKTGYSYAQIITPGYKITFDVEGVHYKVHTNLDGSSTVLCNEPATSTPVPSTPTPAAEAIEAGGTCTLTGGEVVHRGGLGKILGLIMVTSVRV